MRYFSIIFIIFQVIQLHAQDFSSGFEYLEIGAFADAELYFENQLVDYPDNRTVRLCHARAIGLNGRPTLSTQLFSDLQLDYPNDYEIKLNHAESLIWSKNLDNALVSYRKLVQQKPKNKIAKLGLANTLAGLRSYEEAYEIISSLASDEPGFKAAQISGKYIALGFADQLKSQGNFIKAHKVLEQALSQNIADHQLTFSKSILYLSEQRFEKAYKILYKLYQANSEDLETILLLAYNSFLLDKNKQSIQLSKKALSLSSSQKDSVRSALNLIDTYGKMKNWKKANAEIAVFSDQLNNDRSFMLAKAKMLFWSSNYKEAEASLKALIEADPTFQQARIQLLELAVTTNNWSEARKQLEFLDPLIRNGIDIQRMEQKMNRLSSPSMMVHAKHQQDQAGNISDIAVLELTIPLKEHTSVNAGLSRISTQFEPLSIKASQNILHAGITRRISPFLSLSILGGLSNYQTLNEESRSNFTGGLKVVKSLKSGHFFELNAKRHLQNYSSQLILAGLSINELALSHNYLHRSNLGIFSQLNLMSQSDSNKRNLIFSSIYYVVKNEPNLKIGFNAMRMAYALQIPDLYFSPASFHSYELFGVLDNTQMERSKVLYQLQLAIGKQKTTALDYEDTFRINAELGYQIRNKMVIAALYQHTNASRLSVAGFRFQMFGIKLAYNFTNL